MTRQSHPGGPRGKRIGLLLCTALMPFALPARADDAPPMGAIHQIYSQATDGYIRRIASNLPDGEALTVGDYVRPRDRLVLNRVVISLELCGQTGRLNAMFKPVNLLLPASCEDLGKGPKGGDMIGAAIALGREPDAGNDLVAGVPPPNDGQQIAGQPNVGAPAPLIGGPLVGGLAPLIGGPLVGGPAPVIGSFLVGTPPPSDTGPVAPPKLAESRPESGIPPIVAVPQSDTATAATPGGARPFIMPVKGRIVSTFGRKHDGTQNDGIDIAVPEGTPVRAIDDGTVVYVGNETAALGNTVIVQHSDGWASTYADNGTILVKRGDEVQQGEPIAESGKSGEANTPLLHFELRRDGTPVNPLDYLGKG
jgi:Peptidase family M23